MLSFLLSFVHINTFAIISTVLHASLVELPLCFVLKDPLRFPQDPHQCITTGATVTYPLSLCKIGCVFYFTSVSQPCISCWYSDWEIRRFVCSNLMWMKSRFQIEPNGRRISSSDSQFVFIMIYERRLETRIGELMEGMHFITPVKFLQVWQLIISQMLFRLRYLLHKNNSTMGETPVHMLETIIMQLLNKIFKQYCI
jgi:hypothetical protein